MSTKEEPKRGGGVKLAKQFTKIKETLNRNGEVITRQVEKPKDK